MQVGALGARAHRRPAGRRGRAAAGARDPARRTAGMPPARDLRRFLDRNQITFDWVTPDAPDAAAALGRRSAAGGRPARSCARRTATRCSRPPLRDVAELLGLQTTATAADYDTVIIGAGPAGSRGRGVRRLRGPAHDRDRARGAGRPGRVVVANRELSRLSRRRLGRRAQQARAAAGAPPRRGDPRHALDHRHRSGARAASTSTAATSCAARSIILATGVTWRHLAVAGHRALIGKGIYYGAARSEAPNTHGLDVAHHRRRQLGRPGRALLLEPRAHGDDRVPRRLAREEHVAVPRRAGAPQAEHLGRARRRGRRASTAMRSSRRSRSAAARAGSRSAASAAASSSSSAPTRTRPGCPRRSRATSAATC